MFSLMCARINSWVNNREAGDLRRYRRHYDVMVMSLPQHGHWGNHATLRSEGKRFAWKTRWRRYITTTKWITTRHLYVLWDIKHLWRLPHCIIIHVYMQKLSSIWWNLPATNHKKGTTPVCVFLRKPWICNTWILLLSTHWGRDMVGSHFAHDIFIYIFLTKKQHFGISNKIS